MNKIKIITTIGPGSNSRGILRRLKDRKVDFFRINLSHTKEKEILKEVLRLKEIGVPIILDTEGSQIRTGNESEIFFEEKTEIKIHNKEIACDNDNIFFNPLTALSNFKVGDLIAVDFNSVILIVSDISKLQEEDFISCKVLLGGTVGGKKGVHPDRELGLSILSKKDLKAVEIAKENGLSTFTLSFVRKKEDVLKLQEIYPEATIYSKIETMDALKNLEDILDVSEGILVDRGDLSRYIPVEKIPIVQKYIIAQANKKNKDVFIATNTLENMSFKLKPDKSEVNDIINTILDGATGIALTKETAVGKYPVETVNTLISLIKQLDVGGQNLDKSQLFEKLFKQENLTDEETSFLIKPHGGKLVNRVLTKEPSPEEINSMKKLIIDEKVLMDAEQIATGAFSPLEGFMDSQELESVLNNMRLPNNIIWTLPILLQVKESEIKDLVEGERVVLIHEKDNEPYAILNLKEKYKLNKEEVAQKWFGTLDLEHPGVANLMESGDYILGGKIDLIKRKNSPYKFHELIPSQTRKIFAERGWSKVVGFHTRNVIHRSHEFIQLDANEKGCCDGLFVHPIIGKKKKGDFQTELIIKTYEKMVSDFYPKGRVVFSSFATFSRYAGPREAIFTALVRKNFGCSHFIIGRDHTGVKDFYHPKASQEIFSRFEKEELGIIPVMFDNVFYSKSEEKYFHEPECVDYPEEEKLHISGTQAREMLRKGEQPPEWFMRPEISQIILDHINEGKPAFVETSSEKIKNAKILWFTGLSGSGKTTIANLLKEKLESLGRKVKIFDGDIVRKELHKNLGFTPEDIRENNRLISGLCQAEKANYDYILVPIISPFKISRQNARELFKEDFTEILVKCSYEECKKRDTKGLYQKAEKGEIENFIGLHIPYEGAENNEITVDSFLETPEQSSEKIFNFFESP